jgi:DNA-binding NtrC family response regulator
MFFGTKIADAGKKVGYRVYFLREVERLQEKIRELKPDLIIIDTATDRNVWTSLVRAARDVDAGMYPVITFGSHRDLDSRSAALETGASDFIANSRFFPEMVRVFEKYARVPTEYELEEAAREAEARGEPVPDTKGLWRGSNRFKRGPIIPGPAEDDAEDEAPSFLSLRKTGATNPFNPNPDPGGD